MLRSTHYKKSTDSTWTKAMYTTSGSSAYTSYNTATFTPVSKGTYKVRINTKDYTGTIVIRDFTITVK